MGLFRDLMQESKIADQRNRTGTLEVRVRRLEEELERTQDILSRTLRALETKLGQDVDGDGKVG